MLSCRGALDILAVMAEVAATQPRDAKEVFILSEAEKVWRATCKAIRLQLLQNSRNVNCLKLFGIWMAAKHVVTDGDIKYFVRVPQFGFSAQFATTYSLDGQHVPQLSGQVAYEHLGFDRVVELCGVPATTGVYLLRESFRYIGEGLFSGRIFHIDVEGVARVLVKRDKALIQFEPSFLADLFAIDSRKWPLAVREVAWRALRNSPERPSSRARSASSSTPRVRPQSADPNSPDKQSRPAFVSAANRGQLFSDIQQRSASRQQHKEQEGECGDGGRAQRRRGPLIAKQANVEHSAAAATKPESVYNVLPPNDGITGSFVGDAMDIKPEQRPITIARHPTFMDPALARPTGSGDDAPKLPPHHNVATTTTTATTAATVAPFRREDKIAGRAERRSSSSVRDLIYGGTIPTSAAGFDDRPASGRKRFYSSPSSQFVVT